MTIKQILLVTGASLVLAGSALAQSYGGPGMMGGGYGMGAGGGYGMGAGGSYGTGAGMMGGYGHEAFAGLKLSVEQQKKITAIQLESSKAMWQLMGTMHEQDFHMQGMFGPGPFDEPTSRKAFQTMQDSQKAMFELRLEAHRKVDAVLTQVQRDQLRR